jgi:hypothetical protein
MLSLLSDNSQHSLLIQDLNGGSIFRLTRVTRIFQKNVFTETTPGTRTACRAGFFCCATATGRVAARGVFLVFAEKTGKYRRLPRKAAMKARPACRFCADSRTRRVYRLCRKNREIQEIAAQGGDEA